VTTTDERRPRRRRTPGTRDRIAQAALELFSTRGFDGASMRELADRLDMTTAALYYHYADKADILVQLVEPMLDDAERLVADAEQANAGIDERLAGILELLLEHRGVFSLMMSDVSARSHPAISTRADENERLMFRFIAGRTAPRDPTTVIRAVAAVGAMARPIAALGHLDVSEHRDLLLDAGVSAYNATGKRRRRAVRATADPKAAQSSRREAVR
jgi:AcrR family transcriptional regulator